ncbi:MAG: nucleotidyl transferase AbiEii/AbiGii toxin family protein [Gammaproteobacteria bacterium]|nr:MAG: nucleotidyl transferase AbiEii/AbiGii toxin family protein [Gammaproteobacteria bacterium]
MSLYVPVFEALDDLQVRYVVVGGLATVLHGYARLTADIDLIVDLEPQEVRKGIDALIKYGMIPRLPVDPYDFAEPDIRRHWIEEKNMRVFSMWKPDEPLLSVDLFVEHPIEFDLIWSRAEVVALGPVSVRIASIPDLIALKRLANRPQDLIDIEKLTEIQNLKKHRDDA